MLSKFNNPHGTQNIWELLVMACHFVKGIPMRITLPRCLLISSSKKNGAYEYTCLYHNINTKEIIEKLQTITIS